MCRTKSEVVACQMCGTAVEQKPGRGAARLYCDTCRQARARAAGIAAPRPVSCVECGKSWLSKVACGRHPQHCSDRCRHVAEVKRRAFPKRCSSCSKSFVARTKHARLCHECSHKRPLSGQRVSCEQCGTKCYSMPSQGRRFCSVACCTAAANAGRAQRRSQLQTEMQTVGTRKPFDTGKKCLRCGKPVIRTMYWSAKGQCWRQPTTGKGDKRLYCGKLCSRQHWWEVNEDPQRRALRAMRVVQALVCNLLADVVNGPPACLVCGTEVKRRCRKTCSAECGTELGRIRTRQRYEMLTGVKLQSCRGPRPCRWCGSVIVPRFHNGRGRNTCDRCQGYRSGGHEQRAAFYGVYVETVSCIDVFERDNWTCQLCHRQVLRRAKRSLRTGRLHPRTASIDHIVPLSRGGSHSERNCQCACLRCNVRKGSKMIGQTRLF
jgi:hypothetical protein